MVTLLPTVAALQLDNEAFHLWLLVAVLPASVYALTLGCKQHKRYGLLFLGVFGLSLLVLAVLLGEQLGGEMGEKILTVLGSSVVSIGHLWNFRLCQQHDVCDGCSEAKEIKRA